MRRKIKIIIAEDHPMLRDSLETLLNSNHNYLVTASVSNGAELVEHVISNPPDFIITDIDMPIMNGIEAIKIIKGSGVNSKIMALTMHASNSICDSIIDAGADLVLSKSKSGIELYDYINELLDK